MIRPFGLRFTATRCHDGRFNCSSTHLRGEVMAIVTIGIDLAKMFLQSTGSSKGRQAYVGQATVARSKLLELIASLPPCTIGMEACSGAHHWARLFMAHGHTVHLMAPKFVAPYRLSGQTRQNDAADAAAICEAVQRPPHAIYCPSRRWSSKANSSTRCPFIEQTVNRGLLSELASCCRSRPATIRREAMALMEDLPGWVTPSLEICSAEVSHLDKAC